VRSDTGGGIEPPTSLGEAAYRRLRTDIVSCRLAPGQRVTERQLAAETGFGISPLRVALTRLNQEGLVRTLPRKGYQVAPLTPKSIGDLLDVWGIVGPELIRRGHARATPEQRRRVADGLREIDQVGHGAASVATAVRLVELLDEVFAALAEATTNEYLIGLVHRLSGDLARTWVIVLSVDPSAALIDGGDWPMGDLVTEETADELAERARRNIEQFHERVLEVVSRWPSVVNSGIVLAGPAS
jgi:DNA-binding GntR family transcriptional regulator